MEKPKQASPSKHQKLKKMMRKLLFSNSMIFIGCQRFGHFLEVREARVKNFVHDLKSEN